MKKIAVISTVWFPLSHTDVIVSRWLKPYPEDFKVGWNPRTEIVSVFIEQRPDNDIGLAICQYHSIPIFDSIRETLTLGTDTLAVDAILLIGEHGDYPRNEYGQKLYPRKRFFDAIISIFRESGRVAPIFNDKHLSADFAEAREIMTAASELKFPLYAGSSVSHCPLEPRSPISEGEPVSEALALFHGDQDNYGFHTIEFIQSLVEKRGETGIRAVRSLTGDAVKVAISSGEISTDLIHSALVCHGYPSDGALVPFILERAEELLAYQFEYCDGLRVTHLRLQKFVSEWVVSMRTKNGEVRSCRAIMGSAADFFCNFARLNAKAEELFITGKAPTPLERTYLAGGALQAAQRALGSEGRWLPTPELNISY